MLTAYGKLGGRQANYLCGVFWYCHVQQFLPPAECSGAGNCSVLASIVATSPGDLSITAYCTHKEKAYVKERETLGVRIKHKFS